MNLACLKKEEDNFVISNLTMWYFKQCFLAMLFIGVVNYVDILILSWLRFAMMA